MSHAQLASLCLAMMLPVAACDSQPAAPSADGSGAHRLSADAGNRPATAGVVYVSGQGLYFDTYVVKDPLPPQGKFQLLANGVTEFGPGDPGYLGGRWWEDLNHNGVQDADDHYFLCPLLPPGRPTP